MAGPALIEHWPERFGLGERELVSFVGAGGKSTLMLGLGGDLADAGRRVVITTTTKMGTEQIQPPVVDSVANVEANFGRRPGPLFLVRRDADSKVTGPAPAEINELFRESSVEYILVEADGAHGRSLKVPADFEPVIPTASTTVVPVVGIDAVGSSIASACHRPERVAELLGRPVTHHLEPADVARVITSARGGMKDVPAAAKVVVAVTKVGSSEMDAARQLSILITKDPDIDRVVVVPRF